MENTQGIYFTRYNQSRGLLTKMANRGRQNRKTGGSPKVSQSDVMDPTASGQRVNSATRKEKNKLDVAISNGECHL